MLAFSSANIFLFADITPSSFNTLSKDCVNLWPKATIWLALISVADSPLAVGKLDMALSNAEAVICIPRWPSVSLIAAYAIALFSANLFVLDVPTYLAPVSPTFRSKLLSISICLTS